MNDLRIVPREEQDEDLDIGGDSDDETPNQEGTQPDNEMTITALNLLLSVLEGAIFFVNVLQNVALIELISKPKPLCTVGTSS